MLVSDQFTVLVGEIVRSGRVNKEGGVYFSFFFWGMMMMMMMMDEKLFAMMIGNIDYLDMRIKEGGRCLISLSVLISGGLDLRRSKYR